MSGDQAPGGQFDGWRELRFAINELTLLSAKLGATLGADDETSHVATWDQGTFAALDLLERALSDIGTLSGTYVRLLIADKYGRDPLGGP